MQEAAAKFLQQQSAQPANSQEAIELLKMKGAEVTTQAIEWIKEGVQDAAKFVADQAPLFIQEFLNWHLARACIISAFFAMGIILGLCCARYFFKKSKAIAGGWPDNKVGWTIGMIASLLFSVGMFFGVASWTLDAVKIKIAPRVYLVDWLADALKSEPQGRR